MFYKQDWTYLLNTLIVLYIYLYIYFIFIRVYNSVVEQ